MRLCFLDSLKTAEGREAGSLWGRYGDNFVAGMGLLLSPHPWCPPPYSCSLLLPRRGKPFSFLIDSSTGVRRCFGTHTTLQFQGMRFLRIHWQGGLGRVGSQLRALRRS